MSNVATTGYKRRIGFSQLLPQASEISPAQEPSISEVADFRQGKMTPTGNPLDLAISGPGFFQLRAGDQLIYSRQGHFRLAPDGSVVNARGHVLQEAGGGDLVLGTAAVAVLADGTVLEGDRPVARIAVLAPPDSVRMDSISEAHFALPPGVAMEESADALVRQGMAEGSNVAMGDEMVTVMAAMRQAESGARLVQVYDELLGRALTMLGGAR
jgi:flagellar basal-body rod protein FlgG